MKKLLFILFIASFIISCSSEMEPENIIPKTEISEKDQILQAFLSPPEDFITLPSGTILGKYGDKYVFDGDIVISEDKLHLFTKNLTKSAISYYKWPDNIIPYVIDSDLPNSVKGYINMAISHWEDNTSIKFVQRTNEYAYISFKNTVYGGNYSTTIGYTGSNEHIGLTPDVSYGTIIHEIGHIVGLHHEHNRADRDQWINIHWDNICSQHHSQFYKYNDLGRSGVDVGSFDFNSIMLYSSYQGLCSGNFTMSKKNGQPFDSQRNALSTGDKAGVKFIYGDKTPNKITVSTGRNWSEYVTIQPLGLVTVFYEEYIFNLRHPAASNIIIELWIDDEENYGYTMPVNEYLTLPKNTSSYTYKLARRQSNSNWIFTREIRDIKMYTPEDIKYKYIL